MPAVLPCTVELPSATSVAVTPTPPLVTVVSIAWKLPFVPSASAVPATASVLVRL